MILTAIATNICNYLCMYVENVAYPGRSFNVINARQNLRRICAPENEAMTTTRPPLCVFLLCGGARWLFIVCFCVYMYA